jgi:hypothetical protein
VTDFSCKEQAKSRAPITKIQPPFIGFRVQPRRSFGWGGESHKSARQPGPQVAERLPAYAPELNPVEYIWGYWKHHELPNFCPRDFAQLSHHARRALARMRRRPALVMAFWEQAELFPL